MDTSENSLGEFELIRRFFCSEFPTSPDTIIALGDDASVVRLPPNSELIQSIDTQVADVHFPATAPAHLIAQRALRCAISDLAAMGANPQGFHLALTLPQSDVRWLKDFSDGLKKAAHEFNIALIGGDTTRGKQLVISVAVQGWVPFNQAGKSQVLTRSGAQAGDLLYLSGPVGAAAIALEQVLKHPADVSGLAQHYYFPDVPIKLGQTLLGKATSCIDISDGLLQDAGHIAQASGLTLEIMADSVEVADKRQRALCLTGGDDYQLLFSTSQQELIESLRPQFPGLQLIGQCYTGPDEVRVNTQTELLTSLRPHGFSHF